MMLIAKMEGSLSALFHAQFASKRLLIMGIGCGLSFNVGINFIWSNGQVLAINEGMAGAGGGRAGSRRDRWQKQVEGMGWQNWIFDKNPTKIKNYGIWFRYQSRTDYHNMYKEYRDTILNGAVE
ncbi:hypothetical protein PVK06_029830 [Gossypium arboreum]|uniref:Large ribosomal subunit protein eL20 domain-containing protein n=1 Tax=Gossypium arboreum TaxID=29729 RepID=A0ABR0NLV1_GOSAR|nr:hypothetical protein PVK06_029830 [Gossypium arboreum]